MTRGLEKLSPPQVAISLEPEVDSSFVIDNIFLVPEVSIRLSHPLVKCGPLLACQEFLVLALFCDLGNHFFVLDGTGPYALSLSMILRRSKRALVPITRWKEKAVPSIAVDSKTTKETVKIK
jgi:hypothetical protein